MFACMSASIDTNRTLLLVMDIFQFPAPSGVGVVDPQVIYVCDILVPEALVLESVHKRNILLRPSPASRWRKISAFLDAATKKRIIFHSV